MQHALTVRLCVEGEGSPSRACVHCAAMLTLHRADHCLQLMMQPEGTLAVYCHRMNHALRPGCVCAPLIMSCSHGGSHLCT